VKSIFFSKLVFFYQICHAKNDPKNNTDCISRINDTKLLKKLVTNVWNRMKKPNQTAACNRLSEVTNFKPFRVPNLGIQTKKMRENIEIVVDHRWNQLDDKAKACFAYYYQILKKERDGENDNNHNVTTNASTDLS